MEAILNMHEDSVKLAKGMTGKLSIEVKCYGQTGQEAIEQAFATLKQAKNRAIAEGYQVE